MPLDGLKLSAMFQYEDVSDRSEKLINGESYSMRHLYNLSSSTANHIPCATSIISSLPVVSTIFQRVD